MRFTPRALGLAWYIPTSKLSHHPDWGLQKLILLVKKVSLTEYIKFWNCWAVSSLPASDWYWFISKSILGLGGTLACFTGKLLQLSDDHVKTRPISELISKAALHQPCKDGCAIFWRFYAVPAPPNSPHNLAHIANIKTLVFKTLFFNLDQKSVMAGLPHFHKAFSALLCFARPYVRLQWYFY